MIYAAVEQSRIAHGELKRCDCDALAEANGHCLERTPARSGIQSASALLQLNLDPVEKAHLLQPGLLARRSDLIGDLSHPDVGAFHHDLGHRALATERMSVMN